MPIAIGADIGGSGIKAALVDTVEGCLVSERRRVETPSSLQPDDVLQAVVDLVADFEPADASLGIGFPAVVIGGAPRSGFTAHLIESWIGVPVAEQLSQRTGRAVAMLNDADAAGIAEMHFGKGRGEPGVVLLLTLGTGIGSALFVDGRLVPNTELGTIYLRKQSRVAEWYAASEARKRDGLDWTEYAGRLSEYLNHVSGLFSPSLIILGGGISKRADKFLHRLDVTTRVVPAKLRNQAGIIGAAVAATGAVASSA